MTQDNKTSIVGSCDATTCRHNEDRRCTAGQIEVSMSAGAASCLTFAPEAGQQSEQPSSHA